MSADISQENLQHLLYEFTNITNEQIESPFTPKSFLKLKEKINDYAINLIIESVKVTKLNKAEKVSDDYIERASNHLVAKSKNRISNFIGALGGICLGAAFSNYLSMAATSTTTSVGAILTGIFGICGGLLITYQLKS